MKEENKNTEKIANLIFNGIMILIIILAIFGGVFAIYTLFIA